MRLPGSSGGWFEWSSGILTEVCRPSGNHTYDNTNRNFPV